MWSSIYPPGTEAGLPLLSDIANEFGQTAIAPDVAAPATNARRDMGRLRMDILFIPHYMTAVASISISNPGIANSGVPTAVEAGYGLTK